MKAATLLILALVIMISIMIQLETTPLPITSSKRHAIKHVPGNAAKIVGSLTSGSVFIEIM